MQEQFGEFITALAQVEVPDDALNIYAYGDKANAIRRENLRLYLEALYAVRPRMLLVGEAPGYQGCRLTGLPFTSEYVMLNGVEGLDVLGEARGYRKTDEIDKIKKEPSATIVWETIRTIRPLPLIWASYPYHPHKPGKPWSNRAPRVSELEIGRPFIPQLLALFPTVATVVAVGNNAARTLTTLGINHTKVRHPSQGGKNAFVAGMNDIVETHGFTRSDQ